MPIYNREHAKRAISSGSILVVCAQNAGNPAKKELDKAYRMLYDDFSVLGVDINLDKLNDIHEIAIEDTIEIVRNIKSRAISAIESSCGSAISAWFQLSFTLAFIATGSTVLDRRYVISTAKEDLKSAAVRAGYAESKLETILRRLQTDDHLLEDPRDVTKDFITEAFEIIETPRLFISYASADHETAEEFANLCKEAGIDAFVANIDIQPGTDWYNRLGDELRQSDELLVILSSASVLSHWVMIEVGAAWALGKTITPAILDKDINSLPEPIKKFQAKKIFSAEDRRTLIKTIAQRMQIK